MTLLNIILLIVTVISGTAIITYNTNHKMNKKKASLKMQWECDKVLRKAKIDNFINYYWSEPLRFVWTSILLLFMMLLGIALNTPVGYIMSFIFLLITIAFMIFARKSYYWFPPKAKAKLVDFEKSIIDGIEKEISFEGDNIQRFAAKDPEFHTKPEIFTFATGVKKFKFPPLEDNPKKQPVVSQQKLEFLILSREYFSICKGATPFDLLNPKRGPVPKKCMELKVSGECHEYYYSQMQNVQYDGKKECIRIIYNNGHPDVEFPCKKIAPNRKKAMKALKEKLRLTERQKLRKVEEHRHYEELKFKREDEKEEEKQ